MKLFLKNIIWELLSKSLELSNKERGEQDLKEKLASIVPDLSHQYTTSKINMDNKYQVNKTRCQHAFQISIALKAFALLKKDKEVKIVDIGDSAGSHLMYLNELLKDIDLETLSVNLDQVAINKIKSKGLNAILCRAEELHMHDKGVNTDIFLLYETLEHMFNPIDFLHTMAQKSKCEYFVITIPYLYKSRMGLRFIRDDLDSNFQAENTHIFELSPEDWNLIFKFAGWEIVYSDKYTQYPSSIPFSLTKYIWRKFDFDGFYGVILKKNNKYAKQYLDW